MRGDEQSEEAFFEGYHVIDGSVRQVWRLEGGDLVVLDRVIIGFGLEQLTIQELCVSLESQ